MNGGARVGPLVLSNREMSKGSSEEMQKQMQNRGFHGGGIRSRGGY